MREDIPTNANQRDPAVIMNSFVEIVAVTALLGFCILIISPFAGIIVSGVIIAVAINPWYLYLNTKFANRHKLAASILVLLGLMIIGLPIWLTAESSIVSVKALSAELEDGTISLARPAKEVAEWPVIGERIHALMTDGAANIESLVNQFRPQVAKASELVLHIAGSVLSGTLQLIAAVLLAGVLLVNGETGYRISCAFACRIAGDRGRHLTDLSIATVRAVTKGVLGVALIQAMLAAVGLVVIHVPAAGLWAAMVLLLAIMQIPVLLILGPIALWVYSQADPLPATAFAVYITLVGLSDNFLKPILFGRGVEQPMLVIMVGALGGVIFGGFVGLFIGAVVLALGYTIFTDWLYNSPNSAAGEILKQNE